MVQLPSNPEITLLYFVSVRAHLITCSKANLCRCFFVPLFEMRVEIISEQIQRSSQWGNKPLSTIGEILESYQFHTPWDNPLLGITGTFLYIPGDSESTLYEGFAPSACKEVTSFETRRVQKNLQNELLFSSLSKWKFSSRKYFFLQ